MKVELPDTIAVIAEQRCARRVHADRIALHRVAVGSPQAVDTHYADAPTDIRRNDIVQDTIIELLDTLMPGPTDQTGRSSRCRGRLFRLR